MSIKDVAIVLLSSTVLILALPYLGLTSWIRTLLFTAIILIIVAAGVKIAYDTWAQHQEYIKRRNFRMMIRNTTLK